MGSRGRPRSLDGVDFIVLAGGPSTRYGGVQKLLTVLHGIPLIAWHLIMLADISPERIIVALGHDAKSVEEVAKPALGYRRQAEYYTSRRTLGTAVVLRDLFTDGIIRREPIIVTYADTLLHTPGLIIDLVNFHRLNGLELAMMIKPYHQLGYAYDVKTGKLHYLESPVPAGFYVMNLNIVKEIAHLVDDRLAEHGMIDIEDALTHLSRSITIPTIPAYQTPLNSVHSLETPADIPSLLKLIKFSSYAGPFLPATRENK